MDSSNVVVDCGSIDDEGIEVGNFNADEEDDDACWEPKTEMCFSSIDEVKSLYKEYAFRKGFGSKIRTSRKGQDGEVCYLILACKRERSEVTKSLCTLKTRPTMGKNCSVKICIKLKKDGLWYIQKFEPNHSRHTSPRKSRLFKANKKMELHVRRTIQINDDVGVRVNKTFQSLVKDAGGHENIPFNERDVRNYVNMERSAIGKEGDGKALISSFC